MSEIHEELVASQRPSGALNPSANPFDYDVGRVPPVFGSRDPQLAAGAERLQRLLDRRPGGLRILEGVRGVGKTALMARLRTTGQSHGLVTAHLELTGADTGAAETSAHQALLTVAQELARGGKLRALARRLTAIRVGPAGVELADQPDRPVALRDLVAELGVMALTSDQPVFLTVDEAHENPALAGQIVAGLHIAGQETQPIGAYLAGLPGTQRAIAAEVSYAERIVVDHLDPLDEDGVTVAIAGPFADHHVHVDPEVCAVVHEQTSGYPFFVQVWGAALWDHARDPDRVDLADADRARAAVERTVDAFLGRRWARFTSAQKAYLTAVAALGGVARTAEVAAHLGRSPSSVTARRDELIADGALYVPERGYIDFVIPPLAQHALKATSRDQPRR